MTVTTSSITETPPSTCAPWCTDHMDIDDGLETYCYVQRDRHGWTAVLIGPATLDPSLAHETPSPGGLMFFEHEMPGQPMTAEESRAALAEWDARVAHASAIRDFLATAIQDLGR